MTQIKESFAIENVSNIRQAAFLRYEYSRKNFGRPVRFLRFDIALSSQAWYFWA
jgi:hypothetical protein